MKYSNPRIPEGINTSPRHPLKEFLLLTGGILGVLLLVMLVLTLLADRLADRIPFALEVQLVERTMGGSAVATPASPMERYLTALASEIAAAEELPPGMQIHVHYVDSEPVNAFATLGGHIVLFRGLLERLPNENAVAMVLAHEIAHIKYRHPIRSMGRGILFALAIATVSSSLSDAVMDRVLSNTGALAVLKFSRDQEREADQVALEALYRRYGHIEGARRLFDVLRESEGSQAQTPEFFSTHPLSVRRLEQISAFRQRHAAAADAAATPLPAQFSAWLTPACDEKTAPPPAAAQIPFVERGCSGL